MRRRLLILLVFICISAGFGSSAAAQAFQPVKDIETFRKEFAEESGKIQSISSDFQQEKNLAALTEKITSTGKFWFKRSNRVKIEYQKPFLYTMVMNGDKMLIKDNQKENKIDVKSNKLFQSVNRVMVDCIQGTILDSKDFTTKVFENESSYLLEMTPVQKSMREFFSTIVLIVEKKDYAVDYIEMKEPSGDNTTIKFKNKTLNKPVSDEVFGL